MNYSCLMLTDRNTEMEDLGDQLKSVIDPLPLLKQCRSLDFCVNLCSVMSFPPEDSNHNPQGAQF